MDVTTLGHNMAKYNLTLLERVHRNDAIFKEHISGRSIIKISRKYGLTYERTRSIIKEQYMRLYFVADPQDDFVVYEGTLEDCEAVLEEQYGGLMILGYRDLTPPMIDSLKHLRSLNKDTHEQ